MITNPFIHSPNDPERIPNVEVLHDYLLKTADTSHGTLVSHLPNLPTRVAVCKDFFHCNIWEVEPYLLDDLHKAKETHNEAEIQHIREMIRAASWASHGRTDAQTCLKLAKKLGIIDATVKTALLSFLCDQPIEAAVEVIEAKVDEAWKTMTEHSADATLVQEAKEQLHALRPIRDQLYFQRLYTKLCALGKQQLNTASN